MKIFWLAMFVVTLVIVIVMGFIDGWSRWVYYLIFPALALLMYLFRRFTGNRVAKNVEKQNQNESS